MNNMLQLLFCLQAAHVADSSGENICFVVSFDVSRYSLSFFNGACMVIMSSLVPV
jgi:hypothetical protein